MPKFNNFNTYLNILINLYDIRCCLSNSSGGFVEGGYLSAYDIRCCLSVATQHSDGNFKMSAYDIRCCLSDYYTIQKIKGLLVCVRHSLLFI